MYIDETKTPLDPFTHTFNWTGRKSKRKLDTRPTLKPKLKRKKKKANVITDLSEAEV